jgi:hypothetical protein
MSYRAGVKGNENVMMVMMMVMMIIVSSAIQRRPW